MGLVWVFVILSAVSLFGLGGGERPLAVVLFIAALALFRRLFGFGGGGNGRPAGPTGASGTAPLVILAPCGFRAGPARLIVKG